MRTKLILSGVAIACLLLQCSLLPAISIASVTPNLMIAFTASFGLMRGRHSGLLLGFFCGMMTDLMLGSEGGLFIGLRAFAYMYVGYFSGYCYHVFYDDDIKMPIALAAAGDLAFGVLFYVTQFLLRGRVDFFYYLGRVIFPEMVYTVILTLVCYRPFLALNQWLERMDKRSVGSFV